MENQQSLFDFAIDKMREHSVFKFYGSRKTPEDAVEAGAKSLSSMKATQIRSKAFAEDDIIKELNSPTFCKEVDSYVPFWWAVEKYPDSTFAAWDKRVNMAAALQNSNLCLRLQHNFTLRGLWMWMKISLYPAIIT